MSYVKDNLLPNEKVLFSAHIHPAVFLRALLDFLLTLLLFFWGLGQSGSGDSGGRGFATLLLCASGILFVLAVLDLARALIIVLTTDFAVTNKRVIAKRGFIRRRAIEILLQKVESVAVQQGILGRLLDYGTVTVVGTGGTREGFPALQAPLALRTQINQMVEDHAKE
jgi:uncharacterized membrane protein YdbT with pleckstrin-like domain